MSTEKNNVAQANSPVHNVASDVAQTPASVRRAAILARVREALQVPAQPAQTPVNSSAHDCLPRVGASFEEQADAFRKNALELNADFRLCDSLAEAADALTQIAARENWRKIATHASTLIRDVCAQAKLSASICENIADKQELETCGAGITGCDALIAQTGSVLLTSRSAGGRALSVLPPHHLVLARREQLLADLPAAFELLQQKYADNYPSLISFITGPSRTGDIERILVLGAHGPKQLTILCF